MASAGYEYTIDKAVRGAQPNRRSEMKRIMLLAVITGALVVPATAGASGGIGAGGVAACAAALNVPQQAFGSVNFVATPGVPGPRGGPNSTLWTAPYTNNGSALIGLCQSP
jgi:hypothetical protein